MREDLIKTIWECPYGDASTIMVLMALADKANAHAEYSGDMPTIARKARQSERNCRYILRRLEQLDIVECLEGRGRSHTNQYRICVENLQNLQQLPVSENLQNLQKGQSLQVIKPAKPANAATIAGFNGQSPFPFPSDSPSLEDKNQEEDPPVSPQRGEAASQPAFTEESPSLPDILNGTEYSSPMKTLQRNRPRQRFAPETFVITQTMREWAAVNTPGVDLDFQTGIFKDHEFKDGKTDWLKAWHNWMRRAWQDLPSALRGSTHTTQPRRHKPVL